MEMVWAPHPPAEAAQWVGGREERGSLEGWLGSCRPAPRGQRGTKPHEEAARGVQVTLTHTRGLSPRPGLPVSGLSERQWRARMPGPTRLAAAALTVLGAAKAEQLVPQASPLSFSSRRRRGIAEPGPAGGEEG